MWASATNMQVTMTGRKAVQSSTNIVTAIQARATNGSMQIVCIRYIRQIAAHILDTEFAPSLLRMVGSPKSIIKNVVANTSKAIMNIP